MHEEHDPAGRRSTPGDEYDFRDDSDVQRGTRGESARRGSSPQWSDEDPYAGALGGIRALLEQQLRERPLPTLLMGVAVGWIAGKLLR